MPAGNANNMAQGKTQSDIEVIHQVAVVAVDFILKFFVAEIINHIIFVPFKCGCNGSNLFLIDMKGNSEHTGLCIHGAV